MPDNLYHSDFNFYQNANADASVIKDNFLVHKIEYRVIMENVKRSYGKTSTQHYLLVGRRGSGKSTLLKRLQVEIETDSKLSQLYLAINPAEEQANMYRLYDLLEEVIREMEHNGIEVGEYEFHEDAHAFTRQLFSMIHAAVERSGKRLILLLDNMDRIFDNVGEDAHLLREDLLNYSGDIKIIGASTRVTEHFWRYDKPFYEFFRIMKLDPLTSEEMKALLLHWSKKMDAPQIEEFVMNKPGQLETIRLLTDGLPRTLQFFVNILLTRAPETGYEYLRSIMDSMTPLYQERLNSLPAAQRKIVLQMAFIWEAAGAGDIAVATRMENNVVSAQLKQLAGKGIVEKLDTGGRNHLYRLAERFFNLWLIFTQGGPREKRKAKYLTIFLENFYDAEEVQRLAEEHLKTIEEKTMDPNKAALLTKAYAQSKYISFFLRDKLIEKTMELPNIYEEIKKQLPPSIRDVGNECRKLIDKKDWGKALALIDSIEQMDGIKESLKGFLYSEKKEYKLAEVNYLKAIDLGFVGLLGELARVYWNQHEFMLAEEYALKAIDRGNKNVYYIPALVYYSQNKSKSKALFYMKKHMENKPDDRYKIFLIVIKLWNGEFDGMEADVINLINREKEMIPEIVFFLLVHYQENFVHKLFHQKELGQILTDEILPLFYAARLLSNKDSQITLKIPPEIQESVDKILSEIKEGRQHLYGEAAGFPEE
jgi:energy-coupling factor transporter ATP-binding protein EcfA2/DNA-binding transcriptional regulator GbsR (MarR family)